MFSIRSGHADKKIKTDGKTEKNIKNKLRNKKRKSSKIQFLLCVTYMFAPILFVKLENKIKKMLKVVSPVAQRRLLKFVFNYGDLYLVPFNNKYISPNNVYEIAMHII